MDLLDELWSLIFREHLYFLDTIRCRRVSRRFKFLIDQLRPTELLICGKYPNGLLPIYRGDRDPQMWIQLRTLNLNPDSSFHSVFVNLRFLQLNTNLEREFNLELFNEFTRLEKLIMNFVIVRVSQTLRLPALKVFSLRLRPDQEQIDYGWKPRLTIDCQVETLLGGRPNLLVLNHPECIQHLENDTRPHLTMSLDQLLRFRNLRTLHTVLTEVILKAFPFFEHLQELHLYTDYSRERDDWAAHRMLDYLLNKSDNLNRDAKIYFQDVLAESKSWVKDPFKAKIANYHDLFDCERSVFQIRYIELVDYLDRLSVWTPKNGFPVGFFQKFPNIESILVKRTDNEELGPELGLERFLWFLSKCTKLAHLEYHDRKSLTQSLLDQLPVVSENLKYLEIFSAIPSNNKTQPLDLSPIYKLKRLFSLKLTLDEAGLDGSFDLRMLLQKCSYLARIQLPHIFIVKPDLYQVYTRMQRFAGYRLYVSKAETSCFKREELLSNLDTIIEEYRESLFKTKGIKT